MSDELLEVFRRVGNNSCIIGEVEIAHAFQLDFGLRFQSKEIKELSI